MPAHRIHVRSATGSYPVVYGKGQIARTGVESATFGENTGVYLLTSPHVAKFWRAKVEPGLRSSGKSGRTHFRDTIIFDDSEFAKNIATVEDICRRLIRAGADRRCLLVAVGGGVVGDVCGYVAASYLRGVRLVHVPTTLVAQVDSAIGGKTGVNLPEGKNLVGAFYSPQCVVADPDTLGTLPPREYRSGLYEVIKYGVIGDARLFLFLERHLDRLLQRDQDALDFVIPRCIRAKASVVGRDEREQGLREILNFGHTFAHALETATRYRLYRHGEAVGWGMIAASRLAQRLGMLPELEARRIETLVRRTGPLPPLPSAPPARLVDIMKSDKKTRGGKLRFVLARQIGQVESVDAIPTRQVVRVLSELQRAGNFAGAGKL